MGLGAIACGVGMPLLPWQATKKPSSTPPVVPGAAPALAKAGVGGLSFSMFTLLLSVDGLYDSRHVPFLLDDSIGKSTDMATD